MVGSGRWAASGKGGGGGAEGPELWRRRGGRRARASSGRRREATRGGGGGAEYIEGRQLDWGLGGFEACLCQWGQGCSDTPFITPAAFAASLLAIFF